MDFIELVKQIKIMLWSGKNFYVKFAPETLDFTKPGFKAEIQLFSARNSLTIPLDRELDFFKIISILKESIFGPDALIITWNIKNLFSYIKYITKSDFEPGSQLFDLKIIEGYLGLKNKAPDTYAEAGGRLKSIYTDQAWPGVKKIYQTIHVPLITKVIPGIETNGLVDRTLKAVVHPYYEIEGQINGRMKCLEYYSKHFNPHSLSEEVKSNLYPRQIGDYFVELDFHHMEVAMLQWLSGDTEIGKIIEKGDDFYKAVYKLLTGDECDSEKKRNLVKKAFLPVIYGKSVETLAKELDISLTTADKIVSRERKLFPRSFQWIEECQNQPGEICLDRFGRRRAFQDQRYLIRNFVVQSPAALVCLEKLIQLYEAIKNCGKIVCHVHDGYMICAAKSVLETVCQLAKETLEVESKLCPGLKLQSSCKVGNMLTNVKECN